MTSWPIGQLALVTLLNEKVNTVFLWVSQLKSVTGYTRNILTSVLATLGLSFRACWLFCIRLLHYLFTPRPADCMNQLTIRKHAMFAHTEWEAHHSIAMSENPQHSPSAQTISKTPAPEPQTQAPEKQSESPDENSCGTNSRLTSWWPCSCYNISMSSLVQEHKPNNIHSADMDHSSIVSQAPNCLCWVSESDKLSDS